MVLFHFKVSLRKDEQAFSGILGENGVWPRQKIISSFFFHPHTRRRRRRRRPLRLPFLQLAAPVFSPPFYPSFPISLLSLSIQSTIPIFPFLQLLLLTAGQRCHAVGAAHGSTSFSSGISLSFLSLNPTSFSGFYSGPLVAAHFSLSMRITVDLKIYLEIRILSSSSPVTSLWTLSVCLLFIHGSSRKILQSKQTFKRAVTIPSFSRSLYPFVYSYYASSHLVCFGVRFVSNLTGSSILEIVALSTIVPVSFCDCL